MKVVIVGGGVIGCSTAYYLSCKPCSEVILIEQCDQVAAAASGKAGGFLARDWCSGPLDALARRSFDLHAELAEKHDNPWDYRRLNTISVKMTGYQASMVEQVPWLDKVDQGDAGIMGSKSTTAQVTPAKFTRGMMELAIKQGATRLKGRVTGLQKTAAGAASGVVLEDGTKVLGDAIVLCMGPWSGTAKSWVPTLPTIDGSKAHSIVVQPSQPETITDHAIFVSYAAKGKMTNPEIYPRPDGTVYMCSTGDDDAPLPEDPNHVTVSPADCDRIYSIMGTVSTALQDATILKQQACYLPSSPDSNPLLGPVPDVPGLFIATGHTCWGILNAPATGEAMADLIVDGKTSHCDVSGLLVSRFY
eukprot:m.83970 g.83970  ORF g.83970 m.83970 type:complete len:361 (+) comp14669_c0_seq1:58-1140(+)